MMASILFRIIPREIIQFSWYTNSLTEGVLRCQTTVVTQTSVCSSVHHTGFGNQKFRNSYKIARFYERNIAASGVRIGPLFLRDRPVTSCTRASSR
jgi:hypothetical protein